MAAKLIHSPLLLRVMTIPVMLLPVLWLPAPALDAAIYKEVDEKGRTTYSDIPRGKEVKPVDLPVVNTQPAVEVTPDRSKKHPDQDPLNYELSILTPSNGAHIPPGQRDVEIYVQVSPAMEPDFTLQAFLNGAAYGPLSTTPSWLLPEVYRGEHQITVELYDADGELLTVSDPVTVFVFRPTVNTPAQQAKPGG